MSAGAGPANHTSPDLSKLSTAILAASRDSIVVLDLAGNVQFVSPAGIEALGPRNAELIMGQSWSVLWDRSSLPDARDALASAASGGTGRFLGACPPHKRAPQFWDVVVTPLAGADGRPEAMVCVARDVTEQRRAETLLRETEERRREAVEAADIGTWAFDVPSQAVHWDARVRALSGLGEEAEVDLATFVASLHPDDRARVVDVVRAALDPSGPGTYQAEYRTVGVRDGVERWVSVTGRTRFQDGRPVRLVGTAMDITARKRAEERAKLLGGELQHRVKNTLAVVQAIIRQTLRNTATQADAQAALDLRIAALARANDMLVQQDWTGSDLREAARTALYPHDDGTKGRFRLDGPAVWLTAETAMSLALVLNELATNATKYGALSVADGYVELGWTADADPGGRGRATLHLVWRERGGPPVSEPSRRGFGGKLIETGLAGELGGSATLAFPPDGVTCTITAVLPNQVSSNQPA